MRPAIVAICAIAIACAVPAPALAAKRCGSLAQHPSGFGAGVVYFGRSTSGGTTCRKAREVVRAFLRRGVSPQKAVTVRGYVCTVNAVPGGPSQSPNSNCQAVASAGRVIRFDFDLTGGN